MRKPLQFLFKTVVTWILFLVTLAIIPPLQPAQADSNFSFTLDSTYAVTGIKNTTVEHQIHITNKTPTLYVRQYALKITSGTDIKNVRVTSDDQVIQPNVVKTDHLTSVGLTFPDKVVGEGKTRTIKIIYDQEDASVVSGKVLELYVPALSTEQTYDRYSVTLRTPSQYGQPVRVTPDPTLVENQGNQIITHFSQVGSTGVAALFGSEQVFNLTLRYNLENTTNGPGLMQIALPPDTPYQKLHYSQLDPLPQKIEADPDGNWIATYQLPAASETIVYATAQAKLTLEPDLTIPVAEPSSSLLQAQTYWESDQPAVQQVASEHHTPRAMYDYVVNTLSYGFDPTQGTPTRLGAVTTLASPANVNCQEFTDTFIALARANQVPTRRLTGYAHTENSALRPLSLVEDILHAWPEYYDYQTNQWRPIDPTWGNTTGGVNYFDQFDLNHIVFAINGQSSTLPYPAGSYKLTDQNTKDVSVDFGTTFPETEPDLEVRIVPKKIWGISIPGWLELEVVNQTGSAWYGARASVTAVLGGQKVTVAEKTLPVVLPYQTQRLPLVAINPDELWPTTSAVQVTMQLQNYQAKLITDTHAQLAPAFISYFTNRGFLIGLGVGGAAVALATGGILVSRRR